VVPAIQAYSSQKKEQARIGPSMIAARINVEADYMMSGNLGIEPANCYYEQTKYIYFVIPKTSREVDSRQKNTEIQRY